MCFSPEMDAAAGLVVAAIGVDTLRQAKRPEQVALAALPLTFGVHQLIETFVWLGLRGQVSQSCAGLAAWTYVLVACVIVPVLVPFAFHRMGLVRPRWLGLGFVGAGAAAAAANLWALGLHEVPHRIDGHQITYSLGVPHLHLFFPLYVVACCGPGFFTRSRPLQLFALLNLLVVAGLVLLNRNGVISLWCVWAAFTSVLINLSLRRVNAVPGPAALAGDLEVAR